MSILKKNFFIFFLLLLNNSGICQQKVTSHPNIIVFLIDDMGWMDTSVPFYDSMMPLNKRYHTPNMERLARKGVKFTKRLHTACLHAYQGKFSNRNECFKNTCYQLDIAQ